MGFIREILCRVCLYEFLVDLNIWSLGGWQHLLRVVAEVPVAHGSHHSEEEIYDFKKSCEYSYYISSA